MKINFKKTISLIIISASIMIAGNFAQAQQGGQQGPPPVPTTAEIQDMVNDITETLDLTDEKSDELLGLYKSHIKEVKSLMKSRPKREKMESLESEFEKDVEAILTSDQQKLYKAYVKKQKSSRKKR
ncbi:hypothetical protein [Ancylomarina sp. 16SWW S1-10-2]|uniref:hypothetical protein n=1 Tax=Ancylomarina sp. 16SWW S1-10-2 TaxID=2499681 RepID=UPI0012AEABAC|nr:hypothetical protein [Ancylomarina sp. 16SWW S1-10-2]MRT93522.1 hypothetical protein [Ancylomarina sp. 16SWW S1-10-2]